MRNVYITIILLYFFDCRMKTRSLGRLMQTHHLNRGVPTKDIIHPVLICKTSYFLLTYEMVTRHFIQINFSFTQLDKITGMIRTTIYSKSQHHTTVKALVILVTRSILTTPPAPPKRAHIVAARIRLSRRISRLLPRPSTSPNALMTRTTYLCH